jgi:hypothetical protein
MLTTFEKSVLKKISGTEAEEKKSSRRLKKFV